MCPKAKEVKHEIMTEFFNYRKPEETMVIPRQTVPNFQLVFSTCSFGTISIII